MRMHPLQLLLLLAVPLQLTAQTLIEGKIFTSAEQRQYLDYLRKDFLAKSKQAGFNIEDSQIPDIPTDAPNSAAAPTEYSLDGIMTRADGRLTIWLNHQPLTQQQLPANFSLVREGNSLALKVRSNDGHSQLLRPGQTIEINSGAVQERSHKPAPPASAPQTPAPAAEPASDSKAAAPGNEANTTETAASAPDKAAGVVDPKKPAPNTDTKNPQSVIDALPSDVRKDPKALDSMIESLEALRDGLDEDKKQ